MVEYTNHQPNIEHVRDLLSPYLDGEVTDEERALVEESLATLPELRDELESLRQTVALVQALPRVPAPCPFTLSEAGVPAVSPPAPRKLFSLPAWASGLAMLAAALVCVLAAGGLFLSGQFSGGQQAAEIAFQSAAEAPAEEPKAEEAVEAQTVAETVMIEKEVEPEEVEKVVEVEKEVVLTSTPAPAAKEEVFATEAPAAEAAPAEEIAEAEADTDDTATIAGSAEPSGETEAARGRDEEMPADTATTPPPTPSPLPTVTALAAPATEIAEQKASAAGEEGAAQEIVLRLVEIRNQTLRVTPGLIQIEGNIEAAPGSTLQATLQRNGEPFDNWADSAGQQTVVQAGGQFSFNIRATEQANRDLFALEPANYQITIISVGTDEPVIASVFFDTFGPPAAPEEPTATPLPTPSPSPTLIIARLTIIPSATPMVGTSDASTPPVVEDTSPGFPIWLVSLAVVVLVGVLVIVGLIVWVIIRGRK